MGIQINGANDTISASDGSLSVAGQQLTDVTNINATGIVTATTYVVGAGSASAPSITPSGDPDTGLYSPGADQLALATGGSGRLFIDSSGRIGVGNTVMSSFDSWANRLVVGTGSGNNGISIYADSSSRSAIHFADGASGTAIYAGWLIYDHSADAITLATNVTERLRIDGSGRLLVGTTAARDFFSWGTLQAQIEGIGFAQSSLSLYNNENSVNGAVFALGHSRGTSVGSNTIVNNGDYFGAISFYGSDGSNELRGAEIGAYVDGTPGSNDMPGRLVFSTTADGAASPTERMRIDSQGRMGLGTASPLNTLHILQNGDGLSDGIGIQSESGDARRLYIGVDNSAGAGVINTDTHNLHLRAGGSRDVQIYTNGSEKARFNRNGQLLVGTSTSRGVGTSLGSVLQTETTAYVGLSIVQNSNDNGGCALNIGKSRGTAVGATTAVQNNDSIGTIFFAGADGTDLESIAASISGAVDGTPGSNDMPGRLVFSTTADGASSPTERVRIDQSGVFWHVSSTGYNYYLAKSGAGNTYVAHYISSAEGSGYTYNIYYRDNTNTGSISYNGTGITFNNTSDYRLKENILPINNAIDRVKQLRPSRFNFKSETGFDSDVIDGFIAHEVKDVVPNAVTGEKDAINDDGSVKPQQLDQSKLVPLLTAALQEALAKIETLEQRLSDAGIA